MFVTILGVASASIAGLAIARMVELEQQVKLLQKNQQCLDDKFSEAVPTITDHVLAVMQMPDDCGFPAAAAKKALPAPTRPAKVIPIRRQ